MTANSITCSLPDGPSDHPAPCRVGAAGSRMQDVGHPVGAHHPSRTSALRPDKSSGSAQHGDLITEHRGSAGRGRGVEFGTARVSTTRRRASPAEAVVVGGTGLRRPSPRAAVTLPRSCRPPRVWGRWPGEGVIARVTGLGGAALGVRQGMLIAEALPVGSWSTGRPSPTSRACASGPRNSVHRSPTAIGRRRHHHADQPVGQYKEAAGSPVRRAMMSAASPPRCAPGTKGAEMTFTEFNGAGRPGVRGIRSCGADRRDGSVRRLTDPARGDDVHRPHDVRGGRCRRPTHERSPRTDEVPRPKPADTAHGRRRRRRLGPPLGHREGSGDGGSPRQAGSHRSAICGPSGRGREPRFPTAASRWALPGPSRHLSD
jgi:hypothetical protein